MVIALVLGVPAAYGFARFRFRGSRGLMQWLISLRMIPPIVVGLPFYAMFLFLERATNIGLRDTHIGLILTYQTFLLPLVIWMMRGYFAELPAAMEESAMVDGYTRLGALDARGAAGGLARHRGHGAAQFHLRLERVLPGIDFWRVIKPAHYRWRLGTYVVRARVEWGNLFAVNLIIMMPVIVLTIILRQQLVKGLTFGILE